MPRKYNATQESVIRGGYVPFLLQRDIGQTSLKGAIQELNNTNRAAIQQKNVIMEALSKADLNPADAAWRDAYAQQIESELTKEVIGGSYAKALPTAMELAGKVASNPELMARQKANKEYQAHKGVIDNMVASGKLPQRISDQWLEENPYTFKPVVDKTTGRVIGGEEWRPNWRVVEPIDMTQVYSKVGQLAAEEAGGGQNVRFVDENGNPVSNPSSGLYSMEIKTGSTWAKLPAEKLKRIFKAALDQIPGARETFEQDYNNKLWQYGKTDAEGKKAFYGSDIMDNQGIKRSLDEYINYKANPILEGMAYNRVHSTVDYSPNSTYLNARMQQAADATFGRQMLENSKQPSPGMEIPMTDVLLENYNTVTGTANKVLSMYENTSLFKNNKGIINGYINRGDYSGLANFLSARQRFITNPDDKAKLNGLLRLLKSEGDSYASLTSGLKKEDIDDLNAYAAIKSGNYINNPISITARGIADRKNTLFSYIDSRGKQRPAEKFFIDVLDENTFNELLSNMNITKNQLKSHGLEYSSENGKIRLDVHKDTDLLPELASAIEKTKGLTNTNWGFGLGISNWGKYLITIGGYNTGNNPKKGIGYSGSQRWQALMDFAPNSNYMQDLEGRVNNILRNGGKNMVATNVITSWNSAVPFGMESSVRNGSMKYSELKSVNDMVADQERQLIKTGLSHIGDFRIWKLNEDTGNLELVTPDKRADIQKELNAAVDDDKFTALFTSSHTPKGYGYTINVPVKYDDDGNAKGSKKPTMYYVEGINDNAVADAVARNSEMVYNKEYGRARALNRPVYDINGRRITYDAGNEELERAKFYGAKKLEEAYNIVDNYAAQFAENRKATKSNVLIPEEDYNAIVNDIMSTSGYDPNAKANSALKNKLITDLKTEFFRIYNSK